MQSAVLYLYVCRALSKMAGRLADAPFVSNYIFFVTIRLRILGYRISISNLGKIIISLLSTLHYLIVSISLNSCGSGVGHPHPHYILIFKISIL